MKNNLPLLLKQFGIKPKYQKLFEKAFNGEEFTGDKRTNKIPSIVIEKLLKTPTFSNRIKQQLKISNITIIGDKLDLNDLRANYPIYFEDTKFDVQIELITSKTECLFFNNCEINKGIILIGSYIDGQLNFKGSKFRNNEDDNYCIIAQNATVDGHAIFSSYEDSPFESIGKIDLEDITIHGNLIFTGATLKGHEELIEENSNDERVLVFSSAKIAGNVWLDKINSTGEIRCVGAEIGGDFICHKSNFNNPNGWALNAKQIDVKGYAYLDDNIIISGGIKLSGANIRGKLTCSKAKLSKPINGDNFAYALLAKGMNTTGAMLLDEVEITGDVDLTDTKIQSRFEILRLKRNNNKNKIILKSVYAREYRDDESLWENTLDIQDFFYDILYIKKSNNDANNTKDTFIKENLKSRLKTNFFPTGLHFSYQPYLQMAKVLENAGHESESKWLKIKMYDNKRKSINTINSRLWWWLMLSKHLIGYGYNPFKVLKWCAAVWLLGVILYACGNTRGCIQPPSQFAWVKTTSKPNDTTSLHIYKHYPSFDPFIYSLDVFLPVVNLGQQDYWAPISTKKFEIFGCKFFTSTLTYFMYIEILLGWFLTSMLIYGVSGLVKKKE